MQLTAVVLVALAAHALAKPLSTVEKDKEALAKVRFLDNFIRGKAELVA